MVQGINLYHVAHTRIKKGGKTAAHNIHAFMRLYISA